MSDSALRGWERLRHGGLLLDPPRLGQVAAHQPTPLAPYHQDVLRRMLSGLGRRTGTETTPFITFVLEIVCGLGRSTGSWVRGSQVGTEWNRKVVTGETIKPRQLWRGDHGATLPVFVDDDPRLGIGRSRRILSHVLQWLRGGEERLALVTNGQQWRLVFAGLDFDAWCEWDTELWLEEGELGAQVDALRCLLSAIQLAPAAEGQPAPLLQAILDSRKGQAELSAALGERVREAVELLVQAHSPALQDRSGDVDPADTYRAAVRVVMRMVVVLFAESRDLLPRDNALYHNAYGLGGLLAELERTATHGGNRLKRQHAAWPRILSLFRLVSTGSHHPALPVPAYGGELFAPAADDSAFGMERAVATFEQACFTTELMPDAVVLQVLERLTRTKMKVRQGRANTWVVAPVDFSDLSSEYIGILYEGLLDFELRMAPAGDPVIFLAVGNQPALPLSRLEAMDDRALASLLEKMKDTSKASDEVEGDDAEANEPEGAETEEEAAGPDDGAAGEDDEGESSDSDDAEDPGDARLVTRTRAEEWARRAVAAGKLVPALRGSPTPERRAEHEAKVARKARQLVTRVVLPGERYLVRWGGTRKGSGTFYTRPGLAVPLVQRTLRPLAWDSPLDANGAAVHDAPHSEWTPRRPEEILGLKICDPACGSGTFPVGALRFLTDALYASLNHHGRIAEQGDQALVTLLGGQSSADGAAKPQEELGLERLPCRPDDPTFEVRLKAVLRRHVVERCIYGVDLDPLAVELCRLALWIETMDRTLPFSFLDHKIKCGNGLIGAWFDQFQHYPVMAWKNREGGDASHSHGVHFEKNARGAALKEWMKEVLTPDLQRFLAGDTLFEADQLAQVTAVHRSAVAALEGLHDLPVHDAGDRAQRYRAQFLQAPEWQRLKQAMDLWCACWFWPSEELGAAPLPTAFGSPGKETMAAAGRIASEKRFFHWELEFPDVFRAAASGFDAILGNPPWDIAKPSSKEFFSNIDPLYRAYGKQEALAYQRQYFADATLERRWLDYSADFRDQSQYVGHSSDPFGDPLIAESSGDRFTISRTKATNVAMHERWRQARRKSPGFCDLRHPFRHQGSADVNLYKLFLEQAHALLGAGGRLGFIVPSGLYSDHGTGALRELFLDHCQWVWLFGFENREKIFDIHRSQKFNPVIIEKGGATAAIRTAFMRRTFAEWERAEQIATPYTREQVERFSPKSRSILEVESSRDLEILEKIYANSVLLGDDGPNGWGVKYATEFHMTNDSKLFPPRPKWEAEGYKPDEYSRWLKGNWRPIAELWPELGVDPARVVPAEVELEEWLFNSSATPEERIAGAQFVHGHLLKPGDVRRTEWRMRCAQPPYDSLPIPRAEIPAGIILSREADEWIRGEEVEDIALPLYEGRMIGQFDFSQKGWVSGKGRSAVWREIPWERKQVEPQYLMAESSLNASQKANSGPKIAYMRISSSTNARTTIATFLSGVPAGDSVFFFIPQREGVPVALVLSALLSTFSFDSVVRYRLGGLNLSEFLMLETPLPRRNPPRESALAASMLSLSCPATSFAATWLQGRSANFGEGWKSAWAIAPGRRAAGLAMVDALAANWFGLADPELRQLMADCDWPCGHDYSGARVKGFWRVDKGLAPELRQTVLAEVALSDLIGVLTDGALSPEGQVREFLEQNSGSGWLVPESLRLAEFDLGRDGRADAPQPVASRLGTRFLDWQLTQSDEESWRECHLHARNLLGEAGYQALLDNIERGTAAVGAPVAIPAKQPDRVAEENVLPDLFSQG